MTPENPAILQARLMHLREEERHWCLKESNLLDQIELVIKRQHDLNEDIAQLEDQLKAMGETPKPFFIRDFTR